MTAEPDVPPGHGARRADQRPLIERIGLAAIAVVVVGLFGAISLAALAGGEIFLGAMAGIGALMTLWAAATSVRRG
ncbi:MAG: hypothetical protein HYX55_01375 [Chloroflexi bacterium]|nr:hypothetical protein [Chloroflexota bacterium]